MPNPILVVEDYDIDFESAARSFRRAGLTNPVVRAINTTDALRWLQDETPALVLLDMNLPDRSGADVLHYLKSNPNLRKVPVVVWSGNEQEEQIAQVYELGASSFVPKRMLPQEQRRDIENMVRYWFQSVHLPGKES